MQEFWLALAWEAAWLACGVAVLLIVRWLAGNDRLGGAISLAAGPALVVLPVWWLGTTTSLSFTRLVLVIGFLVITVAGWSLAWLGRVPRATIVSILRTSAILGIPHAVLFAGYTLFRGFAPEIRYTEKPMELAFLSAATVAERLPVGDPWFAGYPINYYVYGYVEMGALAKTLGVAPEVAFNLALASLFASAVVAAGAVAAELAGIGRSGSRAGLRAAGLATLFLVGAGNWETAWRLVRDPQGTLAASWWTGPGWNASRVIVDSGFPWGGEPRPTINEFPAFSFVLADLHPHLLGLPLLVAYVASLASTVLGTAPLRGTILTGIVLGCVWITNTWSVPLAVVVAALAFACRWGTDVRRSIGLGIVGLALAMLVALPFQRLYVPSYGLATSELPPAIARLPMLGWLVRTVGVVVWERSSFGELVRAWGTLLLPGFVVVARAIGMVPESHRPRAGYVFGFVGFVVVLALASRTPAILIFGLPAIAALVVFALGDRTGLVPRFALGLLAATWLALLGIEFFFLRDAFGDRMNTVFKVGFDAWVYQAIAIPVAMLTVPAGQARRWIAVSLVTIALGLGLLYTPLSAWKWTDGFREFRGLDGLRYLARTFPDEYLASTWLRAQAPADAVLVEAPGCSYGALDALPFNRVSIVTGRATLVGWDGHEYQWRRGSPEQLSELESRRRQVERLYEEPDPAFVADLLDRYGVHYVYIGTLERTGLGSSCRSLERPNAERLAATLRTLGWEPVFERGQVAVYGRPDDRQVR
ncbi:MAG: DUF2298 domain-containing protein [Thermomicrobium sp.]|nr:DUF2298 domain-containing protein [Thermomicrobium sp.]